MCPPSPSTASLPGAQRLRSSKPMWPANSKTRWPHCKVSSTSPPRCKTVWCPSRAEFRMEKPSQEAVDDVRSAIQGVRADLPGDLRDPVVQKLNLAGTPGVGLHRALQSAWTTRPCRGWSTRTSRASSCRCAAWAPSTAWAVSRVRCACGAGCEPLAVAGHHGIAEVSRQLKQVQQEGSGGRMDLGVGEQPVRTLATVKTAQEVGQIELATSRAACAFVWTRWPR